MFFLHQTEKHQVEDVDPFSERVKHQDQYSKGSNGKDVERGYRVCHSCHEIVVPTYFARKHLFMRGLALLLLVMFLPIMLLLMFLVRLTSPGPALFRQRRVGKNGENFELLKIRTMCHDAERGTGPVLCKLNDARITSFGRVLRFLHLDELPQLINVLRGEMCLIGPRPERPEIIKKHQLNQQVPEFIERAKVLPGITGLAQINLPADLSVECVAPKVKLDLEYIETAGVHLDLRILMCTAFRMLGVRHGYAVSLLRLNRKISLPDRRPKQEAPSRLHVAGSHRPHKRIEKSAYTSGSTNALSSSTALTKTASANDDSAVLLDDRDPMTDEGEPPLGTVAPRLPR